MKRIVLRKVDVGEQVEYCNEVWTVTKVTERMICIVNNDSGIFMTLEKNMIEIKEE